MPLQYEIDPVQNLISITGEYADAAEWQRLFDDLLRDPLLRPGFGFLRDLREASNPVDAEAVIRLMEVVRRFWPLLKPSRAAVLTPREFDPAALAAHALADSAGLPLRVFREYEAAIQWLGEERGSM